MIIKAKRKPGEARRTLEAASLAGRAVSAARAISSGPADAETVAVRLAACLEPCELLERDGDKVYCSGCRCPHWRLSELRRKAQFRRATCPLDKWPAPAES